MAAAELFPEVNRNGSEAEIPDQALPRNPRPRLRKGAIENGFIGV